jgi:hypothetical protein
MIILYFKGGLKFCVNFKGSIVFKMLRTTDSRDGKKQRKMFRSSWHPSQ